jgi:hypothetical protein
VENAYGQKDDTLSSLLGKMRQNDDNRKDRPAEIAPRRLELVEEPLKCVWSGFPGDERSCAARIPGSVVVRAWHREMQLRRAEQGFFHFSWRAGTWLGYGLRDGSVRGVYCPIHCAERKARDPREHRGDRQAGTALQ